MLRAHSIIKSPPHPHTSPSPTAQVFQTKCAVFPVTRRRAAAFRAKVGFRSGSPSNSLFEFCFAHLQWPLYQFNCWVHDIVSGTYNVIIMCYKRSRKGGEGRGTARHQRRGGGGTTHKPLNALLGGSFPLGMERYTQLKAIHMTPH